MTELDSLREELRAFAAARDWDQFHSPKNLAMALSAEAGELLEIFQWLTERRAAASPGCAGRGERRDRRRPAVPDPLCDDKLGIDPCRRGTAQDGRERREVSGGQGARKQQEIHGTLATAASGRALDRGRRRAIGALALGARRAAPERVVIADDRTKADDAYGLACQGTALLWRGDFQNARQMLNALASRADRRRAGRRSRRRIRVAPTPARRSVPPASPGQSQRARTLGMLLIPVDADHGIPLRRAPDVRQACTEAHGVATEPYVASLRELLGLIGAHEWRRKGVDIPALGARIHPHYGVFSPVRGEYVALVAAAPLPAALSSYSLAFDIGTGTGVLAAVLARRGVARVIATDRGCPGAGRVRARMSSASA